MNCNFLYFTDPHIRGNTPSSRKDDYKKALLNKFEQIGEIIKEKKVNYVLCGGDLFHQPEVSYSVLNEFLEAIQRWRDEVQIYTVVGSHDKIGYNANSIYKGALGTLVETNIIKVLEDGNPETIYTQPGNFYIQLSGVSHEFGNDTDPERYWTSKVTCARKVIQICHGPVVQSQQRFPHICTKDIKTEADIVLCGHIHDGFPTHKIGNTVFANPGSLGRIENTAITRSRIPTVLLIEVGKDKSSVTEIPLDCRKGDEIFTEPDLKNELEMTEFLTQLKTSVTDVKDLSYKEIVYKLGVELQVEPIVIDTSLQTLEEVGTYEF